jgi:hypothetical protein
MQVKAWTLQMREGLKLLCMGMPLPDDLLQDAGIGEIRAISQCGASALAVRAVTPMGAA